MDNLISRFSRLVAEGHEERDLIEGPGVHHVGQTRPPPPGGIHDLIGTTFQRLYIPNELICGYKFIHYT